KFSLFIQRALNSNKQLAAKGFLLDMVQVGREVEAVFELNLFDKEPKVIAELQCPTNLISTLAGGDMYGFVFEVGENHHSVKFSKGSGEDDLVEAWSVL